MKREKPQHGGGREALLSAVVQVAAEKGLRGVTFRAVAQVANVSNTLISHHFGSRDALLEAALEWSVDEAIGMVDISQYGRDLTKFRRDLVEVFLENPNIHIFQFEMILEANRKPHLRPAVRRLYERYISEISPATLGPDVTDDRALNRALFASLDGLLFQFLAGAIAEEEFLESVDALASHIFGRRQNSR